MLQINDYQYQEFTPKERIDLTLAALSRGDESEANRLWQTCPQHRYRVHDFEYTLGLDRLIMMGAIFFQKCVYHYNLIKKAQAFIVGLEDDLEHEEKEELSEFVTQTQKLIDVAKKTQTSHTSWIKALFEGFKQFCVEVEIDYENMMKTTTISIESCCHDIDWLLNSDGELDVEYRDQTKAYFLELWQGSLSN